MLLDGQSLPSVDGDPPWEEIDSKGDFYGYVSVRPLQNSISVGKMLHFMMHQEFYSI